MIKTMRNVMIVVAVLITNCQVSEKLYRGPTAAQTTIAMHATKNVSADPRISELYRANFRNWSCMRPERCTLRATGARPSPSPNGPCHGHHRVAHRQLLEAPRARPLR